MNQFIPNQLKSYYIYYIIAYRIIIIVNNNYFFIVVVMLVNDTRVIDDFPANNEMMSAVERGGVKGAEL